MTERPAPWKRRSFGFHVQLEAWSGIVSASVARPSERVAGAVWIVRAPIDWSSLLQQSKPANLRPIKDEEETSARRPLSEVLQSYADRHVPYYQDAFDDVVRSRVRHRQFQDLEAYAAEIRKTKVKMPGGKWQLENFYQVVGEPAAGSDADDEAWEAHLRLLSEASPKAVI